MQYSSEEVDNFKKRVIRSFNDYLNIIKEIKTKNSLIWFRGQSSASYRLIPSAIK